MKSEATSSCRQPLGDHLQPFEQATLGSEGALTHLESTRKSGSQGQLEERHRGPNPNRYLNKSYGQHSTQASSTQNHTYMVIQCRPIEQHTLGTSQYPKKDAQTEIDIISIGGRSLIFVRSIWYWVVKHPYPQKERLKSHQLHHVNIYYPDSHPFCIKSNMTRHQAPQKHIPPADLRGQCIVRGPSLYRKLNTKPNLKPYKYSL